MECPVSVGGWSWRDISTGELIGVADGTGEPVEIQIPPQASSDQMLVTVTKQNYYRYENFIPVVANTGFNELNNMNNILIFPNPSNGKFSLKHEENAGNINITILNTLSKVVLNTANECHKGDNITINLNDQPPGLYYIILKSGSKKAIHKVVIQ